MTVPVLVSVVLVAYNSRDDLARCIPSILAQDVPLEILIVDNVSTDGTVAWLRETYPSVRIIEPRENTGYAGGNNMGVRQSLGEYVLTLNPDTVVHAGALRELRRVVKANPRSFVTPKMLRPDATINACGNDMHYTGITTCTGLGRSGSSYTGILRPFALSGAAIMARKSTWLEVGLFDERFFMYLEDTDLSLRARLARCPILCAADAVITHWYTLGMCSLKFYQLERNRLLMLFKTYEARTLRRLAPGLLLMEAATWTFALLRGPSYLRARGLAYVWLWKNRRTWREARQDVQNNRQISDREVLEATSLAIAYTQLVASRRVARALETGTAPVFQLAYLAAASLANVSFREPYVTIQRGIGLRSLLPMEPQTESRHGSWVGAVVSRVNGSKVTYA